MTQNAPKKNVSSVPVRSRPVLARIARAFAGGAGVVALSVALASEEAMAESWQATGSYFRGASIITLRKLGREAGGITHLREPAPGNNCPGSAFEVMNPRPGEIRCLGYVTHWWWGR